MKLKFELENNVNLVSFSNNRIEISFNEKLSNNFVKDLSEKLIEQLRNNISFEPVAQQFSQAPSSGQGGLIGWVSEGQLDPEIISNIKNIEIGSVSDPIKTVNGFYIIKLNNIY